MNTGSDLHVTIKGIAGTNPQDQKTKSSAIESYSCGVSKPSGPPGTQAHKDAGKATAHEATIGMYPDDSSTALSTACCEGTVIPDLSVVQTGNANTSVYEHKFTSVIVTRFDDSTVVDGNGKKRLFHTITFTYATHTRIQKSGAGTGQTAAGWDFVQNKKV